ncbi:TPA: 8-oxoguanine DNA glycosylase [Clostridioides difficile]|uniref:DNA-3-methyladenine glycosylase family protein n=1 Tax=Clostridioides difficile TaxID=1496 RepID=UPI0009800C1B|nr:DNA glycosylase [Clostridioides difficile]MDK3179500.1 DNA glycosylase [Clostridioides difficile]SJT25738.1 3-methyladenine DNA glycosylase/8-oxoguanine DNA glycosylase [Clostridioides difficile]SJT57612.1 3-methyladenine DNA glycosylase/8-oxoguanine DNA glycosylase [Clostridioides difficile]SJU19968.1 3-methyladenine DNA glycosylase/8-oxoguanine DNA glycosylase [Clostridioides difficile]HBF0843377.1 8-oxoguanine DNA glycosylase [Clostridioides difficile]
MNVYEKGNGVILEGVTDFDPVHIFECGQCFRWHKQEDGSYTGVAKGRILNVKKENDKIYLNNTNLKEFNSIWYNYFDLGTDYTEIKNKLKNMDEYLNKATEFGWGIRILRQDGWEMLISFIISSNNRIPMIQRAIENLSRKFGKYIGEYEGNEYYAFPTPEELNKASQEEIRACQTGFRDKYIKSTTQAVIENNYKVSEYTNLSTEDCRKELLKFNGVGPKVCDCIALFGMQKYDSFPVDVWVKRVMQEFYIDEDMSLPKMRTYGIDKFKEMSGFAQQYLFYYARELGIGK